MAATASANAATPVNRGITHVEGVRLIRKEVTIVNRLGLHARAAAAFVRRAAGFASDVHVEKNAQRVNGKSIMGVMQLCATRGTTLTLIVDGPDELLASEAIAVLIAERFGEAE